METTYSDSDALFKRVLSSLDPTIMTITGMLAALSMAEQYWRPKSAIRYTEQILLMAPGTLLRDLERSALSPLLSRDTGMLDLRFCDFLLKRSGDYGYNLLRLSYNQIALGSLRVLNDRVMSIETPPCDCASQKICEHNYSYFCKVLFGCFHEENLKDEEVCNGLFAHRTEHLVNLLLADSTDDHAWSRAALALSAFHDGLSLELFKHSDVKSFHGIILMRLDDYIRETLDGLSHKNPFIVNIFLPLVSCVANPLASLAEMRYETWQYVASVLLFPPSTTNVDHKSLVESTRAIIQKSDGPSYMLQALFNLIDKNFSHSQDRTVRFAVKALRFIARGLYADMASIRNCRYDCGAFFPQAAHVDDSSDYWAYSMTYLTEFLRTKKRSGQCYVDKQRLENATLYILSIIYPSVLYVPGNLESSLDEIASDPHMTSFTNTVISRLLVMQMFDGGKTINVSEHEALYVPRIASTQTKGHMESRLNQVLSRMVLPRQYLPEVKSTHTYPDSASLMHAYLNNLTVLEGSLGLRNYLTIACLVQNDEYWGIRWEDYREVSRWAIEGAARSNSY